MAKHLIWVLALATIGSGIRAIAADKDIRPDGKGNRTVQNPGKQGSDNQGQDEGGGQGPSGQQRTSRSSGNGISYHGGPVLLGTPNVYYIWYGNWSGNTATSILTDLVNSSTGNISGSPYFNINTTYYDGSGAKVSGLVHYAGSTTDSYSRGTALSDADILTIVTSAITGGKLPKDTNGVYFVLTSADVNETSGFCTYYCGWHYRGTVSGSDIKYSFVGNPDRCPSACEAQYIGPNGNAGADGMASIISHELEEAVTDPDLNAWFDSRGNENADKCAWTFGSVYPVVTTQGTAYANMKLGSRNFLIQRNWVDASGGYCSLHFP